MYYAVELMQSFNKKELKSLQALVNCSYFNTDKKVATLLDLLIQKIRSDEPVSDSGFLSIYNTLYDLQLKKMNTRQLNNLHSKMSMLYGLVQQFLMMDELKKSEKTKTYLLQKQLLERRQYRSFKKFIKERRKILTQTEVGAEFYGHQFLIEYAEFNYAQQTIGIDRKNNLAEIRDSLTLEYVLQQLDFHLVALYLKESSGSHQVNHQHYQATEAIVQILKFKDHPLISVYQSIIDLMENKTDAAFFTLIEVLDLNEQHLSKDNQINFYNTLLNFCVLQVRKGKIIYINREYKIKCVNPPKG